MTGFPEAEKRANFGQDFDRAAVPVSLVRLQNYN
jgi:hypothetical protein